MWIFFSARLSFKQVLYSWLTIFLGNVFDVFSLENYVYIQNTFLDSIMYAVAVFLVN